jgi:hypothetical protein
VPVTETNDETTDHQAAQAIEKEGTAVAAQDQGRADEPDTPTWTFGPQHMKQESLPPKQFHKAVRPRFDKKAYQRELMRKRRASPS